MNLLLCPPPLYYPLKLAKGHDLARAFGRFIRVCRPPENLRCLLLVSRNLREILKALPDWQNLAPFDEWASLFDLFLSNSDVICQFNDQAGRGSVPLPKRRRRKLAKPLIGQMEDYPLFAMLCTTHETKSLRSKYGALQLHLLHAHWRKQEDFHSDHRNHLGEIREKRRSPDNNIKLANDAARAVRYFQVADLAGWLDRWNTFCHPNGIVDELTRARPYEHDARVFFDRIAGYIDSGYAAGSNGTGGTRVRTIRRYLCMVEYTGQRLGLLTHEGQSNESGEGSAQEHIVRGHARDKHGRTLTHKEIVDLGIDPLELADGNATVLTDTSETASKHEAIETARARTRSFEIDRRLLPWNSQSMRLEDFHRHLHPKLVRISRGHWAFEFDPVAATVVAVAAETGRSLDEVAQLRIEANPCSAFAYRPPNPGERCGEWKWDSVSPTYHSTLEIEKGEVERQHHLRYPASEIVTDLIAQCVKRWPSKGGRLFPFTKQSLRKYVRTFLIRCGGDERFTPGRIRHLSWDLLHRLTGGELASICLILGLPHPMAQVELFYAVLETTEAASLFSQSQEQLWGKRVSGACTLPTGMALRRVKFVGCRAFPRIGFVRRAIKWLRRGSQAFFNLKLPLFDPERDAELLNRAVMYAVWHQFFTFGTRAICDPYQGLDALSQTTGIGVLSDKDFATGYKARIILAHERLRLHMRAIEARLAKVRDRYPAFQAETSAKLWLLGQEHLPVELEPTTIQDVMRNEFPFPVNTPRKVMRYLLRKAGLSHTHAEAFMGHWWHGHEPFSPFSSFDCREFLDELGGRMPHLIEDKLGFSPVPGVRTK